MGRTTGSAKAKRAAPWLAAGGAPSSTCQFWTLLEPALKREGLGAADTEELGFHLGEILADLVPLRGMIATGAAPSPAAVRELIFQVIWHWPYHLKHAARLERKMKRSVVGRGLFKRPRKKAARA